MLTLCVGVWVRWRLERNAAGLLTFLSPFLLVQSQVPVAFDAPTGHLFRKPFVR
jgi:hypothetical protein